MSPTAVARKKATPVNTKLAAELGRVQEQLREVRTSIRSMERAGAKDGDRALEALRRRRMEILLRLDMLNGRGEEAMRRAPRGVPAPDGTSPGRRPAGRNRPDGVLSPGAARSHDGTAAPARVGDDQADEVTYLLSLPETDVVLLSLGHTVHLRCDFIRAGSIRIWVSARVTEPAVLIALMALGDAEQLGPGLALPLRPAAAEGLSLPCVLVWQATAPSQAAEVASRVQSAWPAMGRWAVEAISCTPAELERRVEGERVVRRAGPRKERDASVASCAQCGLPLSDPQSVALGIGPECQRRYRKDVLGAARATPTGTAPRFGTKSPSQWVASVRPWLLETPPELGGPL